MDLRGKRAVSAIDIRTKIDPESKTVPKDAKFGDKPQDAKDVNVKSVSPVKMGVINSSMPPMPKMNPRRK